MALNVLKKIVVVNKIIVSVVLIVNVNQDVNVVQIVLVDKIVNAVNEEIIAICYKYDNNIAIIYIYFN